jgi:hypothetical protein
LTSFKKSQDERNPFRGHSSVDEQFMEIAKFTETDKILPKKFTKQNMEIMIQGSENT